MVRWVCEYVCEWEGRNCIGESLAVAEASKKGADVLRSPVNIFKGYLARVLFPFEII
jgi:hypothetical protein